MPFDPVYNRYQWLGASVREANSTIGWGASQQSQLNVSLVDDPANGDNFTPPEVGTPVHFELGSFRFGGLLQKYEKTYSTQGYPVYEALVVDPREILEGAQVVVGAYSGSVGSVKNLLNAYGFWEATGYGNSLFNEGGMPWFRVRDAVLALVNTPSYTAYGGPLTYRGVAYALDLSQLPSPPPYYRVGGQSSFSLLELVAQVCEDGGYDFFVELDGFVIRVKTVSRFAQPPLGTITAVASTNWGGQVLRSRAGVESRNETTSVFVVGGDLSTLWTTTALQAFWGYDFGGAPILGTQGRFDLVDFRYTYKLVSSVTAGSPQWTLAPVGSTPSITIEPGQLYLRMGTEIVRIDSLAGASGGNITLAVSRGMFGTQAQGHSANAQCVLQYGAVTTEFMDLNSSPVADITGSVLYATTVLELRAAKGGYSSWAAFMEHYRPDVARLVGLISPVRNMNSGQANAPNDLVNDDPAQLRAMAIAAINQDAYARCQRMFEFVKMYADEYMGKKYVVGVPFVFVKQDPETLRVTTSYEVAEGGYLPEGSSPLGLSLLNEDQFRGPDGRFRAFVRFENVAGLDLSAVTQQLQGTVIEGNALFMEVGVNPQIIYTPAPAVVITLNGQVFEQGVGVQGDSHIQHAVLQQQPGQAQRVLGAAAAFGTPGVPLAPAARAPSFAALPLKSNVLTYGPWYAAGAPGKVRFEHDPSLTPWNYGGHAAMGFAANAKVATAVTNMQVSESGQVERAGAPLAPLGGVLQSGGPNVTGVSVRFGQGGVATTYNFHTFSPRFGVFTRGAAERMRRLSLVAQEFRRSLRAVYRENVARAEALGNAARTARAYLQHMPASLRRQSPHEMLVSYSLEDGADVRVGVSAATAHEAAALQNADDDLRFRATASMSMAGLLRPFSTAPGSGLNMSSYTLTGFTGLVPSQATLDPWKGQNDIEFYTYGGTCRGLHAYRRGGENANARPLALRGPLVLTGWGLGLAGECVPGSGGQWEANYLKRQDLWKTGPVDHLWDERRGVWTSHDVLRGVLNADLPAGGSAQMTVQCLQTSQDYPLTVHNHFAETLASGSKVVAGYVMTDNRWYAVPATASPLTTKGDLWAYGTADARLPAGASGQALVTDPSAPLGLKWAAPGTSFPASATGAASLNIPPGVAPTFPQEGDVWTTPTDIWVFLDGTSSKLATSPLTTKGDLWGFDTDDARVPAGASGYVLHSEPSAALGVAWKPPLATSLTGKRVPYWNGFSLVDSEIVRDSAAVINIEAETSLYTSDAAKVPLRVKGYTGQSADLARFQDPAGSVTYLRVNKDGHLVAQKNAAPADGDLGNSEWAFWLDDTPGSAALNIKAKDSAGTVVTGQVALS
jgi:hypothetical protein